MDFFRKFTEYFKNMLEKKDKKKLVENAVIVIIIGIIIILAGGALRGSGGTSREDRQKADKAAMEVAAWGSVEGGRTDLEKRLEETLAQIDGVGRVNVLITYESGEEIVPAYDTRRKDTGTIEKDGDGGVRDISESEYESRIVYEEDTGGEKKPVVIKKKYPVVKGVIVVAEGARDVQVRDDIIRAVQALTDVPMHKVQVFERKK